MPLCNYEKVLKDSHMYNNDTITGTSMLINRTNLIIIDVDNNGKTLEECKTIFDIICGVFLPSPNSMDSKDKYIREHLYAE